MEKSSDKLIGRIKNFSVRGWRRDINQYCYDLIYFYTPTSKKPTWFTLIWEGTAYYYFSPEDIEFFGEIISEDLNEPDPAKND